MNNEKQQGNDFNQARSAERPASENSPVQKTTAMVHKKAEDILYSRRFGFKKYEIPKESEETLTEWQHEIEKVRAALASNDKNAIEASMVRDEKIRGDLDTVMAMLAEGNLNERDLTLLAIGLWTVREKSRWKGALHAGFKMIKGGQFPLSSFLQKEGNATCLDTCILFHELTKRFGIAGNIFITDSDSNRFGHRIWKAESGETVDISYAWRRGGFFKSEKEYNEYVKNNKELSWNLRRSKKYVPESLQ